MIIYLKSGGKLGEKLKPDIDQYSRQVSLEEGQTLSEILERLEIRYEQIVFAYVDKKFKSLDYHPTDRRVITLQPPVSGG